MPVFGLIFIQTKHRHENDFATHGYTVVVHDLMNLKFTGLTQNLGQRYGSLIGISIQNAGPTCEFWVNPVNFTLQMDPGRGSLRVRLAARRARGPDHGHRGGASRRPDVAPDPAHTRCVFMVCRSITAESTRLSKAGGKVVFLHEAALFHSESFMCERTYNILIWMIV